MSKPSIAVTGGSGFIAHWIIDQLLTNGHVIHTTVRDPKNKKKCATLWEMQKQYPKHLYLHQADLMQPSSFDAAFSDVDAVIHAASPVQLFNVKDPQKELIDPAVLGTEAILKSVSRFPKIKRVVLTSSIAAINNGEKLDRPLTESDWNQRTTLDYQRSKTLAEQKAWEMAKEQNQYDLVVINPGVVIGPNRSHRTDFFSNTLMEGLLKGRFRPCVPHYIFSLVDVRDVAQAHIQALYQSKAKGRYITVAHEISLLKMAQHIRKLRPDLSWKLPWFTLPKTLAILFAPLMGMTRNDARRSLSHHSFNAVNLYDSTKIVNELQFSFRPLDETLIDMAQSIAPVKKRS